MWPFKRKHKVDDRDKDLLEFLRTADDAYVLAFKARNVTPFAKYATRAVCTEVLSKIMGREDHGLGVPHLVDTNFSILLDSGQLVQVKREVVHQKIDVGRGLKIALGENNTQVWDVSVEGQTQFKIVRIGGYNVS